MLTTAFRLGTPAAVRYPRGTGPGVGDRSGARRDARGQGAATCARARRRDRIAILAFGAPLRGGARRGETPRRDGRRHALREAARPRDACSSSRARTTPSSPSKRTSSRAAPAARSPRRSPRPASRYRSCTSACPTRSSTTASTTKLLAARAASTPTASCARSRPGSARGARGRASSRRREDRVATGDRRSAIGTSSPRGPWSVIAAPMDTADDARAFPSPIAHRPSPNSRPPIPATLPDPHEPPREPVDADVDPRHPVGQRRAQPRDRPGRHPRPALPAHVRGRRRRAADDDRDVRRDGRARVGSQGHAHVAARADPRGPGRAGRGAARRWRRCAISSTTSRAARRAGRTRRDRVPVVRAQERADVGRREPARLRGASRRRDSRKAVTRRRSPSRCR